MKQLRRLIREAVADHARLPRGANSRDDADDRDLDDPARVGDINVEGLSEAFMDAYKEPAPRGRSAGPNVSTAPAYGGILTPEQVLMMFPNAARRWIVMLRSLGGQPQRMSPKELLNTMQFRVDEDDNPPTLYADPNDKRTDGLNITLLNRIMRWDDINQEWEALS